MLMSSNVDGLLKKKKSAEENRHGFTDEREGGQMSAGEIKEKLGKPTRNGLSGA